jgi:hypothetical protein
MKRGENGSIKVSMAFLRQIAPHYCSSAAARSKHKTNLYTISGARVMDMTAFRLANPRTANQSVVRLGITARHGSFAMQRSPA